jgi:hypothetical protein
MVCRFYRAICRKWGPRIDGRRVTVSAWAFWTARETGNAWARNRIDGFFLFWLGQANHCQSCYQRGRAPTDAKGPRK